MLINRTRLTIITIIVFALAALACNLPSGDGSIEPPPQTAAPTAVLSPAATIVPTPTPWYIPAFEPSACQFYVPPGYSPECGYITVPERRDQPGTSTMIQLHVAIFRCTGGAACQPDPVIYLSGGPGSWGLYLANYLMNTGHDAFMATRDFIMFDQRGVGHSQPALTCQSGEGADACRARFISEGIDLSAYNSAASAADIQDIRQALGYDEINLFGVSYGTRLALTTMRDHPDHIRSVILDSAYPPQVNLYTTWAANAERVFTQTFEACAASTSCSAAYPDLENVFYILVDQLNTNPVTVSVSTTDGPVSMQVDGDVLLNVVFVAHYRYDVIENVPRLIYQVHDGVYDLLAIRLQGYFDYSSSIGMNYSVQCYEEVPFATWDQQMASAAGLEHPQNGYFATRLEYVYTTCQTWHGVTAPPLENEPVASDIPTLILAGQFDPITPPEWGDLTAETLSYAQVYHFPHAGHWILRSGSCGWDIATQFVDHPTQPLDTGCLNTLGPPRFN